MSARDQDAIAIVATRIHRIDGKRVCKCDVCRSFRRVVSLAREALGAREAQRSARAFAAKRATRKAGRMSTERPVPNPGSAEARANRCTCNMMRNNYGKGAFETSNGHTRYVVADLCPLHGIESGWRQP